MDEIYVWFPKAVEEILDIFVPFNIHVISERITILESQNLELWEQLKWPTLDNPKLQQKIKVAEESLYKGKERIVEFVSLVDPLWTHLQNAP